MHFVQRNARVDKIFSCCYCNYFLGSVEYVVYSLTSKKQVIKPGNCVTIWACNEYRLFRSAVLTVASITVTLANTGLWSRTANLKELSLALSSVSRIVP